MDVFSAFNVMQKQKLLEKEEEIRITKEKNKTLEKTEKEAEKQIKEEREWWDVMPHPSVQPTTKLTYTNNPPLSWHIPTTHH